MAFFQRGILFMNYRVHAFEGAMLAAKSGISRLLQLHNQSSEDVQVYVLSPVRRSEIALSTLLEKAEGKDERLWAQIEKIRSSWLELAQNMLSEDELTGVNERVNSSFSKIEDVLRAVWLLGEASSVTRDYLDLTTSYFLASILCSFFIKNGIRSGIMETSEAVGRKDFEPSAVFVYGKLLHPAGKKDFEDEEGESEYTASLIAANIGCPLTFWNHRSLLRSASIKDVPGAHVISTMSYAEATELSFFGAPIVHPHSFFPAMEKNIPTSLRYWPDIDSGGTLIENGHEDSSSIVKAFSVVRNVSLINIEGSGLSGVVGISSRLFSALRAENISVVFISQASSEYSICIAVRKNCCQKAVKVVRNEFKEELEARKVSSIEVENDCAILAVVGDNMTGSVGVAGKFFSSLARAGVNVRAIAQGSSERNISAVIKSGDSTKALRALHSVFFLSAQTLSVGLFGPGNIGGTLLDQISKQSERLKKEFDLDIRIRGIATSSRMLLSEEGVDLKNWRSELENYGVLYNEKIFMEHIAASYYPHKVIIDCTSSEERALTYKSLMEAGFHIITPNKKAFSARYGYYKSLIETSRSTGYRFYYETTVGAGLPIITTLKDLRETGDRILKVEGMVSGTLAWLFSRYDGTVPFSELVRKAREMGYTEPDPRDDLSGMDVARKTVILARELGYRTEVSDIDIRSLVPEELRTSSKEEFLDRLCMMDERMEKLYNDAKSRGMKLRYVGKVDSGVCSVSLAEYPLDHPFSQADGTDNVIAFTTERYLTQPLVIKGPGAGPEVTAAGVFADMLRLGQYLGSRI